MSYVKRNKFICNSHSIDLILKKLFIFKLITAITKLVELINGNVIMEIVFPYQSVVMEILIVLKTCRMREIVQVSVVRNEIKK